MMTLLLILSPLLLFFSIMGLYIIAPAVVKLCVNQFHCLTRGKYDPDEQTMCLMLSSLMVNSETDWDITEDGANFPKRKDGAWKILLSLDQKTNRLSYASYGGSFKPMNPYFEREFRRELREQLANGARKSFYRTLFPQGMDQLRLEAPIKIRKRLELDYNPDSIIVAPALKKKITSGLSPIEKDLLKLKEAA